MRGAAAVAVLVLAAAGAACGTGPPAADACVAPADAGVPPAPRLYAPDPRCLPLQDEERCEVDAEPCRGANYYPIAIHARPGASEAYVEILYGTRGLMHPLGGWIECPQVIRYRVGLDDGLFSVVGRHCVSLSLAYEIEAEIEARSSWPEHYLCRLIPERDLEVRVVPTIVPYVGVPDFGPPQRDLIWLRRHSTGERVGSWWSYYSCQAQPAGFLLPPRVPPDWTDGCCTAEEGCADLCGGSGCGCLGLGVPLPEEHEAPDDGLCYATTWP